MLSRQFLLFLLAGGTAALANFGSRIVLGLAMPYVPAIILAYCIGMLTAFLLNRAFVFANPETHLRHQALWFLAINLAALLQTIVVSLLFARWIFPIARLNFHPEAIAHAIGVAIPVVTSYLGHRRFTFRAKQ